MPDPVTVLVTSTAIVNAAGEFITAVAALIGKLAAGAVAVAGAAAVIAKYLPPPDESGKGSKFYKWINRLGQNGGYAANKIE